MEFKANLTNKQLLELLKECRAEVLNRTDYVNDFRALTLAHCPSLKHVPLEDLIAEMLHRAEEVDLTLDNLVKAAREVLCR